MNINLSNETIETVCRALEYRKKKLSETLESGKGSETLNATLEFELEKTEDALATFEELMEEMRK